ncbi:hypothetical protein M0220_13845 [Halomonas qinghailakensis]|uniref:Uncharacterized protein n=1 Tax=Halomonas qinghailakensis TaxID=2937790 RepID=A0AA46TPQ1_9GAMM|nr:hypothetical protein [Halomonas sp. ZZQ-149]UYO73946.1 hypothetical protein M0220_13845 [Halomonas sp. ZZQ-149]
MLEFIGFLVVAYFLWKVVSAGISGGVKGHIMRSVAHATSLGVPYEYALRMISNRKIMKDCRSRMLALEADFSAKDGHVQNGEIIHMLYKGHLEETDQGKATTDMIHRMLRRDPAEEIIPSKLLGEVTLSDILERAENEGVPREESLLILKSQRVKLENLLRELDQLQGGVAATGKMGDYGWIEPAYLWRRNIVRAIESIYGERFENRSSDWGTDEDIRFLIQRAANNPDSMHRYPNLKFGTVAEFVNRCKSGCEWYEGYGGVQFWCPIGEKTYHTVISTLVPELQDESGVKIRARLETSADTEKKEPDMLTTDLEEDSVSEI